jgi:hypothetical protein
MPGRFRRVIATSPGPSNRIEPNRNRRGVSGWLPFDRLAGSSGAKPLGLPAFHQPGSGRVGPYLESEVVPVELVRHATRRTRVAGLIGVGGVATPAASRNKPSWWWPAAFLHRRFALLPHQPNQTQPKKANNHHPSNGCARVAAAGCRQGVVPVLRPWPRRGARIRPRLPPLLRRAQPPRRTPRSVRMLPPYTRVKY